MAQCISPVSEMAPHAMSCVQTGTGTEPQRANQDEDDAHAALAVCFV